MTMTLRDWAESVFDNPKYKKDIKSLREYLGWSTPDGLCDDIRESFDIFDLPVDKDGMDEIVESMIEMAKEDVADA